MAFPIAQHRNSAYASAKLAPAEDEEKLIGWKGETYEKGSTDEWALVGRWRRTKPCVREALGLLGLL